MKIAIFLIMLFNTGCAIHERNAYLEAENKALRAIAETDEIDLSRHARYEIHDGSRGLLAYSSERRCVCSTGSNLHAPFYELSDIKISENKITAIGINKNDFSSASAPKERVTPAKVRITVTAKKYSRINEHGDGFITEFTGTILVQDDP